MPVYQKHIAFSFCASFLQELRKLQEEKQQLEKICEEQEQALQEMGLHLSQ